MLRSLVGSEMCIRDRTENEVVGLKSTVEVLLQLRKLKRLSVQGNPIANEEHARLYTIYMMPWLQVLDGHAITDLEKMEAKEKSKELGWSKGGGGKKRGKVTKTAFGKTYSRPVLPKAEKTMSRVERMLVTTASNILGIKENQNRRQLQQMSQDFGMVLKPAPPEELAPFGHDHPNESGMAISFKNVFKSTLSTLDTNRARPRTVHGSGTQTARARVGDHLAGPFWLKEEPKSEIGRPSTACASEVRRDQSITLDVDMFAKFKQSRREASKGRPHGKLFKVGKPVIGKLQEISCQ
eukprot:TRINITY_DN10621_c0_g1_i1.p1 TRINITY_DN10621_c0_g1~~TRINITY_DN10621_c0_g1_i1.p1  ORF type:complete len:295 (+),score=77.64 TRINITY_DN10621_c0_g1_i1:159-1043(+)